MPTFTPQTPNSGNGTPIPPIGGGSMGAAIGGGGNNGTLNNSSIANAQIPDELENYNTKFKTASAAQFRDSEIEQAFSILIGNTKPNILMEGQAGVGKTKIVEDLAMRLATDNILVPTILKGYTIYELQLSSLVAGNGVVGEVEEAVKRVINFLKEPANKAIVFIDEIHLLFSDRSSTYDKIAQMFKPALARGDLKCIGATTIQEGAEIMRDPAFSRRFTRLLVPELTKEQTNSILTELRPKFMKHYKDRISFHENLIPDITNIATEYQTAGSHRPDNAITLMDRAIANAYMKMSVIKAKASQGDSDAQTILNITKGEILINKSVVKETAIRIATGTADKITIDLPQYRKAMSVIKGQDHIIPKVEDIIRRWDLNLFPREKPLTVLFAGSSGVGKTETATILAKQLMGTKPIIVNCTEYSSHTSMQRLVGVDAGYVGCDSHQERPFDSLETNPYQVILLDEFEKGHPEIQRLFMQTFDKGTMRMANGKELDFSKTIIICTTNAAHTEKKRNAIGFTQAESSNSKQSTIDELSKFFDLALLNRFTHIFTFNDISKEVYTDILNAMYEAEIARIKATRRISLPDKLPEDVAKELVDNSYLPDFGARPVRKTVVEYIENAVLAEADKKLALQQQADDDDDDKAVDTTADTTPADIANDANVSA
jgi:ATP-dependent Clp protease ATP-binding subunit ClpC